MLFKKKYEKKLKQQFRKMKKSKDKDVQDLVWMLELIDNISVRTGHGEITVTSLMRLDNPDSLHYFEYKGRAADFRVRDKKVVFYLAMVFLGKVFELLNPKFRIQPHPELFGKGEQHIHIEIRS